MRKVRIGLLVFLVLLLLLGGALLLNLLLQPRLLKPSWSHDLALGPSDIPFVFTRPQGGVILASKRGVWWYDAKGQLEHQEQLTSDKLFFPSARAGLLVSGTTHGKVLAFNSDGSRAWSAAPFKDSCSTACAHDGTIYAFNRMSKLGTVDIAVYNAQGALQRKYFVPSPLRGWPKPLIDAQGTVYAASSPPYHGAMHAVPQVSAFDAQGRVLWIARLGGYDIQQLLQGPEGNIYVVAHQDKVYCLAPKDGQVLWSFANPQKARYWAGFAWYDIDVLPDGNLQVESEGWLFTLSPAGKLLRSRDLGGNQEACAFSPSGTTYTATVNVPGEDLYNAWHRFAFSQGWFKSLPQEPARVYLVGVPESQGRILRYAMEHSVHFAKDPGADGELYGYTERIAALGQNPAGLTLLRYDP